MLPSELTMYGVSEDIPLQGFMGQEVVLIGLSRHMIHIHFDAGGEIAVEGQWELTDREGRIIDQSLELDQLPDSRDVYRVHRLLGARARRYTVHPPTSFTIGFDTGFALTVYDNERWVSFQLRLKGQPDVHI